MPANQPPTFEICALQANGAAPEPAVVEEILNVYRQCEDFLSLGPAPASLEMVLADLAHSLAEGGRFCAIRDRASGEMLGIVDYVPWGFEGDERAAFLSLLMIAGPHREHGLGESVVRVVEQEIHREGRAQVIFSGVQVNNPRAIRFWQRMGYAVISGPQDMGDGTTAFRLRK